ncbi:MAG: hypothetical protein K0S23_1958 [Fluviicola sp.]|jgi:hypothetical protein|uniref:DUF4919 domain-containing protein n=1 Tax=Fluviicola sp. TaxID=1917219 RepID=UPI002628FB3B|nr:DUF4919 domain-containing protein [Fluviicola sp.]MDF3027651.1 hypothetical protein [Fluviicola sp.]
MKNQLLLVGLLFVNFLSFGQNSVEIVIPTFKDKYSESVKKLEAGETNINYQDFRYSFIESEQFIIASGKSKEMDSLKKEMYTQMRNSNSQEIINLTKQILSIDYTDMMAHKILRQTYKNIGDTVNASKYKTIQFGLLNSIVKNGDGQTCATAWPVVQVTEEYFILQMLDAKLQEQSIDRKDGLCDRMDVKVEGKKKTYYFETTKVFEGYKKLGL